MEKKIRLLYFINSLSFGGVEKHIVDLINYIDEKIIEIYLICPEDVIHQFESQITKKNVTIVSINIRGVFAFKDILRFIKLLKKVKPQIVNSHLYYASRFASPLAKLMGTPIVLETGHIVERWRTGYKKIFLLWDMITSLFVDKVIAVSNAVAEYYIVSKKVPRSKIEVIHNWCDFKEFNFNKYTEEFKNKKKEELGISVDYFIAGIVGRLEEQKGHKYLIQALPEVIKEFPKIKILFIGDGSLKDELLAMIKIMDLGDNIIFMGFRNDIPELLSIIDVIILPSLYEGLPLTLIEAAAMGIPAIASNVDGTPDVIKDGETGYLFKPCDSIELAQKIIVLLRDKNKAKEMGKNGQLFVKRNFNYKTQINKTQSFYLKTLKDKVGEKIE